MRKHSDFSLGSFIWGCIIGIILTVFVLKGLISQEKRLLELMYDQRELAIEKCAPYCEEDDKEHYFWTKRIIEIENKFKER